MKGKGKWGRGRKEKGRRRGGKGEEEGRRREDRKGQSRRRQKRKGSTGWGGFQGEREIGRTIIWIWGKSILRRGAIKWKSLEVALSLVLARNSYGFNLVN